MMNPTKPKILYVEDNEDSRDMLSVYLETRGFDVSVAANCTDAIKYAGNSTFDLFILDSHLPDCEGVELCQRLDKIQPHVPVLYYTAKAYEWQKRAAMEECGDSYLTKPAGFDDLEQEINKLLAAEV